MHAVDRSAAGGGRGAPAFPPAGADRPSDSSKDRSQSETIRARKFGASLPQDHLKDPQARHARTTLLPLSLAPPGPCNALGLTARRRTAINSRQAACSPHVSNGKSGEKSINEFTCSQRIHMRRAIAAPLAALPTARRAQRRGHPEESEPLRGTLPGTCDLAFARRAPEDKPLILHGAQSCGAVRASTELRWLTCLYWCSTWC
jgi:hypothetical protein